MTTQSSHAKTKMDVFTIVNNRILEQLEKGRVPWRQPWSEAGPPKNMITGRSYRGLNILLLSSLGYPHNLFLTLKQINIDQCVNIPDEKLPELHFNENVQLQTCEEVLANMPQKPKIQHKGQEAYYSPTADIINMPKLKSFVDSEAYYTTLYHELVHSTGHESRLKREAVMNPEKYGSESYSEEELVAQIGACFLASHTGCSLKHFENDVAYIQGWLNRLKDDRRLLLFASSKAQRATDFILNNQLSVLGEDIGNSDGES